MEIGESATAVINARDPWNQTGIRLIAGEQYHLRADGQWVDWFVTCDADGYDSVNLVQKLSESLRRSPRDRWFALMGCIGRGTGKLFRIGTGLSLAPDSSGDLFCFANDAPLAYWNNRGAVQLTVRRIK
jgi:hypothetical protein